MSDYDLETAEAMLSTSRLLYVGFMCHQAVEKALKGYYVFINRNDPPYTHNLSYLAKRSGLYDLLNEKQKDFLDTLEPLNIEARYPTYKAKLLQYLNLERCAIMVSETRGVLAMDKAEAIKLVKKYSRLLSRRFPAKMVILYGSYAKGTARPDSDIDVAIVVDKFDGDLLDAHMKLFQLRRNVDIRIEPVLIDESSERDGFLKEILSTGYVVYRAGGPPNLNNGST
ncbi:MAG TPA: HEPN domain-containing protein [Firmicutes bacterium]|nr:HEPN domain-containing protein [Bacillota bacterium]